MMGNGEWVRGGNFGSYAFCDSAESQNADADARRWKKRGGKGQWVSVEGKRNGRVYGVDKTPIDF